MAESGKSEGVPGIAGFVVPVRDQYRFPVNGVAPDELRARMQRSIEAVRALWPEGTGLTLFAFDYGEGGGLSYISTADRQGMIDTVREWLQHQEDLG